GTVADRAKGIGHRAKGGQKEKGREGQGKRLEEGKAKNVWNWRKPVRVELTPPALSGKRPVLKTGRATGPRWLPLHRCVVVFAFCPLPFSTLEPEPVREQFGRLDE